MLTTILLLTVAVAVLAATHWPRGRTAADGPTFGPGASIPLADRKWDAMGQGNL